MTALPTTLQNSLGRTVRLGRQLGKGGEGAVYEAKDQNEVAVKLYWPNKAAARREKIGAMVAAGWYKANSFVAFPADVLFGPNGAFAGFLMKRIGGHKPVHLLYSPSSRKLQFTSASFPFLVRAAINTARAVASVHANSCVIGDVNHSGFLVSEKATITLIDSDSFQVAAAGKNFLCHVGTPDYTPPELQGAKFDQVRRTINHDNFGLAVLIFQLLFMGRHPYSGRYSGSGDMPLERGIKEFRFAYSSNKTTGMQPPPAVPLLTDFPDYVASAFEEAFGKQGVQRRPTAEAWISILGKLEAELQQCASRPPHHHVKGKPCPWCRMEQAFPGFLAFTSGYAAPTLPTHIDIGQFISLISAVGDPGPAPDIQSVLQPAPLNIQPSTALTIIKRQYGASIVAAVGGLLLTQTGSPGIWGYILFGIALLTGFLPSQERAKILVSRKHAEGAWRNAEEAWSRQTGNQKFIEVKNDAQGLIRQLGALPAEERRELQLLEQRKRNAQMNRYLERFSIESARIRKIGTGRKAVLASFGIETATDVERNQLQSVPGFGPTLIAELLSWRQKLESRFVFNPHEPVNPADLSAAKAKIAAKKVDTERKLRVQISSLHQAASAAFDNRNALIASVNAAHLQLKRAEAEEAGTLPVLVKTAKFLSVSCLVIGLMAPGSLLGSKKAVTPPQPSKTTASQPSWTPPAPVTPPQPSKPVASAPRANPAPPLPLKPFPQSAQIPAAPLPVPRENIAPSMPATAPSVAAPPLPPPTEIPAPQPAKESDLVASPPTSQAGSPKLDLLVPSDAKVLQNRLYELGYLLTPPDGKWGPRSKRSLQEFKTANSLGNDDGYDLTTESRIFSDNAARASAASFIGNWTPEAGSCENTAGGAPLRIVAGRADTADGYCRFDSVNPAPPNSWRISARCFVSGEAWPANITLSLQSGKLRWQSERGKAEYFRCAE